MNQLSGPEPANPRVSIGHVHLKVADLERAMFTRALDLDGLPAEK